MTTYAITCRFNGRTQTNRYVTADAVRSMANDPRYVILSIAVESHTPTAKEVTGNGRWGCE